MMREYEQITDPLKLYIVVCQSLIKAATGEEEEAI